MANTYTVDSTSYGIDGDGADVTVSNDALSNLAILYAINSKLASLLTNQETLQTSLDEIKNLIARNT